MPLAARKSPTTWKKWPNANIGVPTGKVTGFFALDVDPRNGGDVAAAIKRLPETVRAKTGGGGVHLLFKHPGFDAVRSIGKGYDIKATGGYVVLPPSVHESGAAYEWEVRPGINAIAQAPETMTIRWYHT